MAKKHVALLAILLGVFVVTGCDDFYSTSWGIRRVYDPAKITLTRDNLDDWITIATGNPELAEALAEKIKGMVEGMGDTEERAEFQSAGVQLAMEASGLGTGLLSNIEKAAELIDAKDDIDEALVALLNTLRQGFNWAVPKLVAAIVKPSISDTPPEFTPTYKSGTSATDVGDAAIILIVATAGDTSELTAEFQRLFKVGESAGKKTFTPKPDISDPDNIHLALAAYLNFIAAEEGKKFDDNPITKSLKDVIKQTGTN